MDLQNVALHVIGGYTGGYLMWEYKGFRYHIWENDATTLYKNSMADQYQPGYFDTRKLDATAKANAPMIAEARAIAEREGLYPKAVEEKRLEDEAEEAARTALHAKRRKEHAAEAMYDALKLLFNACARAQDWEGTRIGDAMNAAETALNEAEGLS